MNNLVLENDGNQFYSKFIFISGTNNKPIPSLSSIPSRKSSFYSDYKNVSKFNHLNCKRVEDSLEHIMKA